MTNTISGNPTQMPSMCGTVRPSPNLALDAISIRLFGPGVKNVGMAAARKATGRAASMVGTHILGQLY